MAPYGVGPRPYFGNLVKASPMKACLRMHGAHMRISDLRKSMLPNRGADPGLVKASCFMRNGVNEQIFWVSYVASAEPWQWRVLHCRTADHGLLLDLCLGGMERVAQRNR
jgi:hypothetical protein